MIPPLIDMVHKTVIKDKESGERAEGLGRSYQERSASVGKAAGKTGRKMTPGVLIKMELLPG